MIISTSMDNNNNQTINSMTPIDVSKITITPEQLKKALTAHLKAAVTRNGGM